MKNIDYKNSKIVRLAWDDTFMLGVILSEDNVPLCLGVFEDNKLPVLHYGKSPNQVLEELGYKTDNNE